MLRTPDGSRRERSAVAGDGRLATRAGVSRLACRLFRSASKASTLALSMTLVGMMISLFGRDARLVALEILGHQLHALIAPLEGLLHDGAGDGAFLDAAERDRIFVEADDGDLAELAGFLQRLIDRGVL